MPHLTITATVQATDEGQPTGVEIRSEVFLGGGTFRDVAAAALANWLGGHYPQYRVGDVEESGNPNEYTVKVETWTAVAARLGLDQ